MPGDWAGAFISVETRDYPDTLSIYTEASIGYNAQTTFRNILSSERSSTDWLGFDNGFRNYDHEGYVQFNNEFVPYLSIIDVMMFNDPSAIKAMLNSYELL